MAEQNMNTCWLEGLTPENQSLLGNRLTSSNDDDVVGEYIGYKTAFAWIYAARDKDTDTHNFRNFVDCVKTDMDGIISRARSRMNSCSNQEVKEECSATIHATEAKWREFSEFLRVEYEFVA